MAHLWANGPCPPEYLELILCRDVYHCTPPQLRAVPLDDVLVALTCLRVEAEVRAMQRKLR